jgi:hypothetical protein
VNAKRRRDEAGELGWETNALALVIDQAAKASEAIERTASRKSEDRGNVCKVGVISANLSWLVGRNSE